MEAEEQSNRQALTKQRYVSDFLHVEKITCVDIHQQLLSVYGDQTFNSI
jgi:hypothetical protein